MPDNKLKDNEIIKALKCCNEPVGNNACQKCPLYHSEERCSKKMLDLSLNLINRLQAENEKNENIIRLADKTIETANAEIERLKNAYKQCAWERDIFAEDMTQEIKKDCSFLMLDIKTIKTEAYKECLKKFEKNIKDVKVTLGQTWEIQNALKKTLNELVGDDNA